MQTYATKYNGQFRFERVQLGQPVCRSCKVEEGGALQEEQQPEANRFDRRLWCDLGEKHAIWWGVHLKTVIRI